MRVIRLQAENFKKLVAVDITPAGDVVTITGKNAAGKSSILDAIFAALAGADAVPDAPIRKGQREGRVSVDLGEYVVTRTFRLTDAGKVTTSLAVENGKGARFPSPQSLIDKLIGKLSFDPLAFARAKPKDQFDGLSKLVPGVDFTLMANQNRGDYEKRTDVNRRAKEARAAAGIIAVPEKVPERVDEKALVEEMQGATQRESDIAAHGRERQGIVDRIAGLRNSEASLKAHIQKLQNELALANRDLEDTGTEIAVKEKDLAEFRAAPERIDVSAVASKLNAARDTNRNIDEIQRKREQKASLMRLADSLEAESDQLSARIDARNSAKDKAIAEAKMPVAGIGFGDGEVLLNGVPFAQGSSAEQLRTSVAIAAALNPGLKVLHVRDGSLLDSDSMAWLAEFAADKGYQIWVETVGTDDRVGILIEDGAVKSGAGAESAAA